MHDCTLYEQVNGQVDVFNMGRSLDLWLANIIMVELDDEVAWKLLNDGTLKFYIQFVDDLWIQKPTNLEWICDL